MYKYVRRFCAEIRPHRAVPGAVNGFNEVHHVPRRPGELTGNCRDKLLRPAGRRHLHGGGDPHAHNRVAMSFGNRASPGDFPTAGPSGRFESLEAVPRGCAKARTFDDRNRSRRRGRNDEDGKASTPRTSGWMRMGFRFGWRDSQHTGPRTRMPRPVADAGAILQDGEVTERLRVMSLNREIRWAFNQLSPHGSPLT